ncbi:MAG: type IV secretory system conjugative DNA transfer family protein [Flavobacteriaceae bacterium]|nr:type IV secretory system conjugative DNA transfer family protein [Flavobacteriaceae bacterium]
MPKSYMGGFATKSELDEHKEKDGAFILGKIHSDHGVNFSAGIKDDRHLFMVAGSRAGKGTTMIIPNLLKWKGGVFCIDPKGENATITAIRRGTAEAAKGTGTSVRPPNFIGQNVAILDPFKTVRGPARKYCVNYDPMLDITIDKDEESSQILAIAEAIVVQEKGSGSHFTESVETIIAGLIEAVIHSEDDPKKHTLTFCRKKILKGFEGLTEYLGESKITDAGLAQDAYSLLQQVGDEEGGSFASTISRQMKWIADPRIQRHLNNSGFSLVKALRENWSVYICIPPSKIPRMKRWLRAMVRIALDAKMDVLAPPEGERTLFILDEFYALGHLQLIEDAAAYMAGYGIKLVPVIQNIGQIKNLYDKNWETFLGNAGGIIAWGLNDLETEKYISDRLGQVRDYESSFSSGTSRDPDSAGARNRTDGESIALRDRAIRWPNEIHKEGAREENRAFIISASGPPFMVERVEYMKQQGQGLYDSMEFVEEWEAHRAEHTKTSR